MKFINKLSTFDYSRAWRSVYLAGKGIHRCQSKAVVI
jgi:hypothetical protein